VAAGVRRVEAVCGKAAEMYVHNCFQLIQELKEQLKHPKDLPKAIEYLLEENSSLKKAGEAVSEQLRKFILKDLLAQKEEINGTTFIGKLLNVNEPDMLKKLCHELKDQLPAHLIILGAVIQNKPHVAIGIDQHSVNSKGWDAGKIIKETVAPLIKGGGGGQKTLATAGGQDASGLQEVLVRVRKYIE
jgi:alanyl-tRNA synthetase